MTERRDCEVAAINAPDVLRSKCGVRSTHNRQFRHAYTGFWSVIPGKGVVVSLSDPDDLGLNKKARET